MSDEKDEIGLVEVSERNLEEKIRDFSDLLGDIENLDDKVKHLCKEIYENAIADRQNSYVMFTKLARMVSDKSTEFAVHGKSIRDFIERMQKANDQLSRLLELIIKVKHSNEVIDPESMFDQIKKGR